MCALKRPYDGSLQTRITAEAQAVRRVLAAVDAGRLVGLRSLSHNTENSANNDAGRRDNIDAILGRFKKVESDPASVAAQATALRGAGFSRADALHLAWAEAGEADAFLTVDDRFLKAAARNQNRLKVPVVNPVDFVTRWRL